MSNVSGFICVLVSIYNIKIVLILDSTWFIIRLCVALSGTNVLHYGALTLNVT